VILAIRCSAVDTIYLNLERYLLTPYFLAGFCEINMRITAEDRNVLMRLRIGTKAILPFTIWAACGWSTAFANEIRFEPRGGAAIVRDASVGVAETLNCRAPFTPVEVELRPQTGGVQVSNQFFEFGKGEQGIGVIRPNRGLRSYNSHLLTIGQTPPQIKPDNDEETSDTPLEPIIAAPQEGFGSYVATSISLLGCAYRSHLDLIDGTLALSGEIGRYSLEFATSFSEILTDGNSIVRMRYAATVWETETFRQRALRSRWPWPVRPTDIDSTLLLGTLFLDVLVAHPVTVNLGDTGHMATTIIGLNLNVIDAREDVPAQDVQIETVSRFAPVEPLTERN
jgi:hypothetical protein